MEIAKKNKQPHNTCTDLCTTQSVPSVLGNAIYIPARQVERVLTTEQQSVPYPAKMFNEEFL